jgi:pre-mRNA-splicing factor SYF1
LNITGSKNLYKSTGRETINARKATANLHRLYINFAKFYEEGGVLAQAEPDLDSARKILEKGTKVNFKAVEDLAEVWCEWYLVNSFSRVFNP